MSAASNAFLLRNLPNFYFNGELCDLTIICEDQEFKVHKVILAASSDVFCKMLTGNFKEAVDTSGKLKLSDEVDALQALLYYVYHGTYSDSFCIDGRKMAFAVRVYGIADFYQLGQLRDFATAELEKILEPATIDDHMDFFTAVHFAEERSNPNDSSIRNMLFDALKTNLEELVQKEDFSNFISQHPELNMRLLSALADATSHPTRGDRKRRASPVSSFPSRSKWGYSAGNYIDTDDSE